jgi:hypothetical protein
LGPTATVTFTLIVPDRTPSTTAGRRIQYVSPTTASIIVTLTAQNGTALNPTRPYALPVPNISVCHPQLNSVARSTPAYREPQGRRQTCTFSIPAPVGDDTFWVATYDAVQASATPKTPAGNLLSIASVSTTVVANAANTVTLTLGGVIAALQIVNPDPNPTVGSR